MLKYIRIETKMFEKIIANLPYNPAILNDLGFYAKRIRQEDSLRRLGFLFIFLTFFVQFFAFLSPPKPSVAASTNDMINGGFTSISELTADCNANLNSYETIISYYGLSCNDLASGQTVSLISTSHNDRLFSMGWDPQGPTNIITHKPTDEQPVSIPSLTSPLYWRYLWSWDTGKYSTYQAVQVTSSLTGKTFYILYTCGNLVSIGLPTPYSPPKPPAPKAPAPAPKPAPTSKPTPIPITIVNLPKPTPCAYDSSISANSTQCKPCSASLSSTDTVACIQYSKTASDNTKGIADINGKMASAGDEITYSLTAYNSGKAEVKDFVMQDDLSYVLDYANIVNLDGGSINNKDVVSWPAVNIMPTASETHKITVTIKNPIPQTLPSTSDPEYFDHIMTNIYGNTINIKLPYSPIASTALVTSGLPNTGPGDSLIVAAIIVVLAGYFFARTRLLTKESRIAIQEYSGGGA